MASKRKSKRPAHHGPGWVKPQPHNTWGREDTGTDVWTAALDRTRASFAQFDHCSIMFSGGKDSTAVLQLALIVGEETGQLPLDVVFFDEEAIPYETEDYVRRVAQDPRVNLRWLSLPVQQRNSCSRDEAWWWCWDPDHEDLWCRPLPPESITYDMLPNFPIQPPHERPALRLVPGLLYPSDEYGTVAQLMGIRADESLVRRRAVANERKENWVFYAKDVGPNIMKAYPIYDWTTQDVWTAPEKFGWDYNRCVTGEAPIWTADYRFKPVSKIEVGDRVIGWTEGNGRARTTVSIVTAVHRLHAPIVKVTMESGRMLRCTPDHNWQVRSAQSRHGNWLYGPPEEGFELAHVVDPVYPMNVGETAIEAAWLGGMYDGEGSWDRIYQNAEHNPAVHERIGAALDALGIPGIRLNERSAAQHGWRIGGGRQGLVDFINLCGPTRVHQFDRYLIGRGRFRRPDPIVSVEPDGKEDVYALTTTTNNYVAWGYASSNSYDMLEMAGMGHHGQRCAPPYAEQPMQALWTFKCCFPDLWEPMCRRVPGASTAALYARTGLYSFHGVPDEPPEGLSWQEFIRQRIEAETDPVARTYIANKCEMFIRRHFKKTSDPLVSASHPVSGIGWKWLYKLVDRGDHKDRMSVEFDASQDEYDEARANEAPETLRGSHEPDAVLTAQGAQDGHAAEPAGDGRREPAGVGDPVGPAG